jgi:hypothetical protein
MKVQENQEELKLDRELLVYAGISLLGEKKFKC